MDRDLLRELKQVLYPDDIKCIICGEDIHPNRYGVCESCKFDLNENFCLRCGRHKVGIGDYCGECSQFSLSFDEARSAVNYDGCAKSVIWRLKYGSARYLTNIMSQYLLDVVLLSDWHFDCFTFVPMHVKREKKRGYNQAQELAQALADRTTLPCTPLLSKTKSTINQAKLNRQQRMENLIGAFSTIAQPPDHVVLVDDVMTTGSTANECSKVLKAAGAKVVYVLTFASVPEHPLTEKSIDIKNFRR